MQENTENNRGNITLNQFSLCIGILKTIEISLVIENHPTALHPEKNSQALHTMN